MDVVRIGMRVVKEGRPFVRSTYCDGDPESGPYALVYHVIRWGKVELSLGPRGDMWLILDSDPIAGPGFPLMVKVNRKGLVGEAFYRRHKMKIWWRN